MASSSCCSTRIWNLVCPQCQGLSSKSDDRLSCPNCCFYRLSLDELHCRPFKLRLCDLGVPSLPSGEQGSKRVYACMSPWGNAPHHVPLPCAITLSRSFVHRTTDTYCRRMHAQQPGWREKHDRERLWELNITRLCHLERTDTIYSKLGFSRERCWRFPGLSSLIVQCASYAIQ
jgi:hypothetical protein